MSTITRHTPTFDPHPIFAHNETASHSFSSPGHPAEVSAQADAGGSSPSPSSPSGQSLVASPFFEDLLDPNLTPLRICQLHGITLADLRRITESQEYKQALEDIAAINENRREAINDQLRTEALASAAELIKDATKLAEDNRTRTTDPSPRTIAHTNPEAHRRALSAATRQHAANARLLETRRKAINTILKECKDGAMQAPSPAPACFPTPYPRRKGFQPVTPPSTPLSPPLRDLRSPFSSPPPSTPPARDAQTTSCAAIPPAPRTSPTAGSPHPPSSHRS